MQVSKLIRGIATASAVWTCLAGGAVRAAEGEDYKEEVVGYGGFQHFPDIPIPGLFAIPGAPHVQVGGAIGRVFGGNSVLFAETSYAPSSAYKMANFGGGVNFGFPTKFDKLVPYVVVAGGLGRDTTGSGSNGAMFAAGFGARYFIGSNWGLRPEFRFQRYQDRGLNTYVFTAGLFYRVGRR
jgi:hypothetical protein